MPDDGKHYLEHIRNILSLPGVDKKLLRAFYVIHNINTQQKPLCNHLCYHHRDYLRMGKWREKGSWNGYEKHTIESTYKENNDPVEWNPRAEFQYKGYGTDVIKDHYTYGSVEYGSQSYNQPGVKFTIINMKGSESTISLNQGFDLGEIVMGTSSPIKPIVVYTPITYRVINPLLNTYYSINDIEIETSSPVHTTEVVTELIRGTVNNSPSASGKYSLPWDANFIKSYTVRDYHIDSPAAPAYYLDSIDINYTFDGSVKLSDSDKPNSSNIYLPEIVIEYDAELEYFNLYSKQEIYHSFFNSVIFEPEHALKVGTPLVYYRGFDDPVDDSDPISDIWVYSNPSLNSPPLDSPPLDSPALDSPP